MRDDQLQAYRDALGQSLPLLETYIEPQGRYLVIDQSVPLGRDRALDIALRNLRRHALILAIRSEVLRRELDNPLVNPDFVDNFLLQDGDILCQHLDYIQGVLFPDSPQ